MCAYVANRVSVIVPTYCEACNLFPLVDGIVDSLAQHGITDYEIIVVDDNSPDNTREVCQSLAHRYPIFKLVTRTGKRGLATAIKRGIDEADGDIIVTMDADSSHDPTVIPLLVNEILNNRADIVVASRFTCNHRIHAGFHRVWGSKALNLFIRSLLRIPVKDVTGGFHAIRRDVLNSLDMDSIFRGHGDYSFALLYEGARHGLKIKEIGFTYRFRKNGLSKTKFLRTGFCYAIRALRLRLGLGYRQCHEMTGSSPEYQGNYPGIE